MLRADSQFTPSAEQCLFPKQEKALATFVTGNSLVAPSAAILSFPENFLNKFIQVPDISHITLPYQPGLTQGALCVTASSDSKDPQQTALKP